MTNTITKIEDGGGGDHHIPGDSTVLSVFAAAACGVDLREHALQFVRPGEFYDLRELQKQWKAGTFGRCWRCLPMMRSRRDEVCSTRWAQRSLQRLSGPCCVVPAQIFMRKNNGRNLKKHTDVACTSRDRTARYSTNLLTQSAQTDVAPTPAPKDQRRVHRVQ